MNQTGNQLNLQILLVIGMVVLIIITATSLIVGGQVYWWQKNIADKEKKVFQRQITTLQNELSFLREDLGKSVSQKTKHKNNQAPVNDEIYINALSGLEQQVITALKNKDMTKLATLVHPEKGIRFSPFSYVDTNSDRIITQEKIKNFFNDPRKYTWGYSDSDGLPIRMNSQNYYDSFVFDCDYSKADEISYNTTIGRSLTVSNIFEVYPRTIIVEFGKDPSDSSIKGEDWRSIKLIFEKYDDNKWYLVGIVHDQWKI